MDLSAAAQTDRRSHPTPRWRSGVATIAIVLLPNLSAAQAASSRNAPPAGPDDRGISFVHRAEAASARETRISVAFQDTPLPEALARIAALARLRLVFADGLVPSKARITLHGNGITPREAFSLALIGTPLEVVISPSGYAAVIRRNPPSGAEGRPVPLSAPPPPDGFELNAAPRRGLGRTVVDPAGQPVRGAYVRLCGTRRVELTDSAGRFRFPVTAADPVRVSVSHPSFVERIITLSSNAGEGVPLTLASGASRTRPGACREP